MSTTKPTDSPTRQDIVLTRIIDAPVERVWEAWTDPEQVVRWWGPTGFTSPSSVIDLRDGGMYVFAMRAPDFQGGSTMYSGGVYTKVVPLERLEFTQGLTDKDGNRIDPTTLGMPPDFPDAIRTVLTFERLGDATRLTATEYDWTVGPMLDMSEAGLSQSLDKLVALLSPDGGDA